jgi:bifunctional ADP-heptose synthase (sugar kinase/adenylyltransferase)
VRELKGPNRPVSKEEDWAFALAGLQAVDGVCIFPDRTALRFLER